MLHVNLDERFSRLCGFVNFEMQPLEFLSVEQSIRFHAQLTLNCNTEAISHRVSLLTLGSVYLLQDKIKKKDMTQSFLR